MGYVRYSCNFTRYCTFLSSGYGGWEGVRVENISLGVTSVRGWVAMFPGNLNVSFVSTTVLGYYIIWLSAFIPC